MYMPGAATTSPAQRSPITAIIRPIPATIPWRSGAGTTSTSFERNLKIELARNRTPAMKVAASACCQVRPNPPEAAAPQRVKAKKKLSPIPGASATGSRAKIPAAAVASAAPTQVAIITAPVSMPAAPRTTGFTRTM